MRRTSAVLAAAALLTATSGCSSGSSPDSPLNVTPPTAQAAPGSTLQFAAVGDAAASSVAWSVLEPEGGTIDAEGRYTAPQAEGTFTVVATSASDPALRAHATVNVTTAPQPPPTSGTAPPSDGTTPWAPSPDDAEWVNVQSFGAVGDAATDDTAAFQAAAATGKKMFVPGPPVAYKLTGVVRIENSVYGDGSMPEIRMYGADGDPDQRQTHNIFYVLRYQGPGLVLNGLHLNGQWNGGANGEWSHGINVSNSRNVTIQHCKIERAYGDDIFVGGFSDPVSDNIVIQNNTLLTARRCNVAVNHATNVVVRNNQIEKTGSTYVSAIDLEPDELGFQVVRGVRIDGNTFNVVQQEWNTGAISLNNPAGNPSSGDVSITNNRGTWSPVAGYMDVVPGSGALVGIVPHQPWYDVTASNNVRD